MPLFDGSRIKRLRDRVAAHRREAKPIAEKFAPAKSRQTAPNHAIEDHEEQIAPPPKTGPVRSIISILRLIKALKGITMDSKTVEVKSAWASKINWTQAVAFLAMIGTVFGIDVPEDQKVAIVALIQAGQSLLTWVLKTWFTTTVTAAAAKKA